MLIRVLKSGLLVITITLLQACNGSSGSSPTASITPSSADQKTAMAQADEKTVCGLTGSIAYRVKDCAFVNPDNKHLVLVARSKIGDAIWWDQKTGLLWSPVIKRPAPYKSAIKLPFNKAAEFCSSGLAEVSGIRVAWRLPEIDEYRQALLDGIESVHKDLFYLHWSSTVVDDQSAWSYGGAEHQLFKSELRVNSRAIRCIATTEETPDPTEPAPAPQPMPAPSGLYAEVMRVLTTLDWADGLSQWTRSMEVKNCSTEACHLLVTFSSPQICPVGTNDSVWCDEVEFSGTATFRANGFVYTSDDQQKSGVCSLEHEQVMNTWVLRGDHCDDALKTVHAYEGIPKPSPK